MDAGEWYAVGVSERGPGHVKGNLPNQDSWSAFVYDWGSVAVVSDGLGSKAKSEIGSKAVCSTFAVTANNFRGDILKHRSEFLKQFNKQWHMAIEPYSYDVCSATCLFALMTDDNLVVGRLGDGMIVVLGDENHLIKDDKEHSFSNITDCMALQSDERLWEIRRVDPKEVRMIILCTDGIADDLEVGQEVPFAQALLDAYDKQNPQKVGQDMGKWLKEWPVAGHSDDKTICCVFRR